MKTKKQVVKLAELRVLGGKGMARLSSKPRTTLAARGPDWIVAEADGTLLPIVDTSCYTRRLRPAHACLDKPYQEQLSPQPKVLPE
jgi:hypothetical protein